MLRKAVLMLLLAYAASTIPADDPFPECDPCPWIVLA
jgi:hypothetical protein